MKPESTTDHLSEEARYVTQHCGTEPPFSGRYWDCHDVGTYRCVVCNAALFDSGSKYDSGSGWPSFTAPLRTDALGERQDASHGMLRTEIHCQHCGAHLGHVFDDGPAPNGVRYCINSAALMLEPSR